MSLCNIIKGVEDGLVRVTNNGDGIFVYFTVSMFIGGVEVRYNSPILRPGQVNDKAIPGTAYNIIINIYASIDRVAWGLFFTGNFAIPADYCYDVNGNIPNVVVNRVPCNGIMKMGCDTFCSSTKPLYVNTCKVLNNRNNAEDGLIRVSNLSQDFWIFFIVTYQIGGQRSTLISNELIIGQMDTIILPGIATNIQLKVYASVDGSTWSFKFIKSFDFPGDYCYNVGGNFTNPTINRVPCNNIRAL